MKYTLKDLIEKYQQNQHIDFLFFWGHKPNPDGTISRTCLSQWWQSAFIVDGITYFTAEHWMMAKKAALFNDANTLKLILEIENPAAVKKLGRKIKDFDPAIWDLQKYEIVKQGNIHKFGQHPELKAFLLSTNQKVLVEASPFDTVWGIGLSQDAKEAQNPNDWKGENLLGFALMEARDELRLV